MLKADIKVDFHFGWQREYNGNGETEKEEIIYFYSGKGNVLWAKSPKKQSVYFGNIWHSILSAELTKTHSLRLFFFTTI